VSVELIASSRGARYDADSIPVNALMDVGYGERYTKVHGVLERLEGCAPELPTYFAALEHPGFRHWERLLAAAEALLEAHGRERGSGRHGRLSERAFAWRVWRVANVYHGATTAEMMRLEGGISRRAVQQARVAWERPSARQRRLFDALGLFELEQRTFAPLARPASTAAPVSNPGSLTDARR
jgi:hypothetical protein